MAWITFAWKVWHIYKNLTHEITYKNQNSKLKHQIHKKKNTPGINAHFLVQINKILILN